MNITKENFVDELACNIVEQHGFIYYYKLDDTYQRYPFKVYHPSSNSWSYYYYEGSYETNIRIGKHTVWPDGYIQYHELKTAQHILSKSEFESIFGPLRNE